MRRNIQVALAAAGTIIVLIAAHTVHRMPDWITRGWILPLTLGISLVALIVAIAARCVVNRLVAVVSEIIAERIAYAEQRGRGEAYIAVLEGQSSPPSLDSTRGRGHLRPLK